MAIYQRLGIAPPFDQAHKLVTSPFFSPRLLATIRLIFALYTFVVLLLVLINSDAPEAYLSYFTRLTYIGQCAYFWAAGVQTFSYARKQSKWYPLQGWPKWLQLLHVLLLSTVVVLPIIVTIVFWALLAGPETFRESRFEVWSTISQHAINTVMALFEIFLTNAPPALWIYTPFGFLVLAGYLGVAYITNATQGFYTYTFLDPGEQGAWLAAYIVGIAVGYIIVFTAVRYLMVFREKLAIKRGWVASEDNLAGDSPLAGEGLEQWEDVERPRTPVMSQV